MKTYIIRKSFKVTTGDDYLVDQNFSVDFYAIAPNDTEAHAEVTEKWLKYCKDYIERYSIAEVYACKIISKVSI